VTKKKSQHSIHPLQIHKDRDYARTYLKGKKIMLGRWGTPEVDAKFRQLQIQILTDPTLATLTPQQVIVDTRIRNTGLCVRSFVVVGLSKSAV